MMSHGRVGVLGMGLVWLALAAGTLHAANRQETQPPAAAPAVEMDAGAPTAGPSPATPRMTFFELLLRGGWLMWPLAVLSLIVLALAIERAIALRRERLLPSALVREIAQQSELAGGFDPRHVFRLCQTYPSSAARILRALLLKVGRPQGEIEHAVSEAVQREANRLQSAVSWLGLAAVVAPLIGLLGTVWGITQAFYDFTQLALGQNPGSALAQGIYTALVTTLAGLSIAIPAAVLAHYFENRILNRLNDIDEMVASLLPLVERYEGRVRFNQAGERPGGGARHESLTPSESAPGGP